MLVIAMIGPALRGSLLMMFAGVLAAAAITVGIDALEPVIAILQSNCSAADEVGHGNEIALIAFARAPSTEDFRIACVILRARGLIRIKENEAGPATGGENKEIVMQGFVGDIEEMIGQNTDFRRVLYTASTMQLALMGGSSRARKSAKRFTKIGIGSSESRKANGKIRIDGAVSEIRSDMATIVPAGARHDIGNTGDERLELHTIYAPAERVDGTVHATKAEAAHEHGRTTE